MHGCLFACSHADWLTATQSLTLLFSAAQVSSSHPLLAVLHPLAMIDLLSWAPSLLGVLLPACQVPWGLDLRWFRVFRCGRTRCLLYSIAVYENLSSQLLGQFLSQLTVMRVSAPTWRLSLACGCWFPCAVTSLCDSCHPPMRAINLASCHTFVNDHT